MKALGKIFATFFGLGFFPVAPGTLTSLAVVLLYRYLLHSLPLPYSLLVLALLLSLGVPASSAYSSELKKKDPGRIVIDEAAGQFLVFILVPPDWTFLVIGFLLFRFFDILKPFPVRRLEALSGGWGIMADDVAAGLLAKSLLHLYIYLQ
jgi:phosphatidylglycerophosphatase A